MFKNEIENRSSKQQFFSTMPHLSTLLGLDKNKLLLKAADHGDINKVLKLLDKGADIKTRDKYGETSLHLACRWGKIELVKALLTKGASIKAKDNAGWTPLHEACKNGNVDVVEALLTMGVNMESKNNMGQTPLDVAKLCGKGPVVKLLNSQADGITLRQANTTDQNLMQSLSCDAVAKLPAKSYSHVIPITPDANHVVGSYATKYPAFNASGKVSLTDDDVLFLRMGRGLVEGGSLPVISEKERAAIQTLATNMIDFERSLESVRELPKSLSYSSPEISSYFFFFTNAFERTFVAAQAIGTGAVALRLKSSDVMMLRLLSGASWVAEKNQLPFVGCISIFSAIIAYRAETRDMNTFSAFEEFFRGQSRDQYLITYRKLAEQICLRLDSASLAENHSNKLGNCGKRVREIIEPVKKHLRKVHLLSLEKLTPVQARAMVDLSTITKEVLRLHQNEHVKYHELRNSNESVKASYFVGLLFSSPSDEIESLNHSPIQENCQIPPAASKPDHCKFAESTTQMEKIQSLEEQIQRLMKQAEGNASIVKELQQTKAKVHKLETKLRDEKDVTVTSGSQAQVFINPTRPKKETQELERRLDQIEKNLCEVQSEQDSMRNHQEKQDQELEKIKVDHFIHNRVLSSSEAYDFTETLIINACGRDMRPMNICVTENGQFQLNGKQYCIGKVCKGKTTKTLWKGKCDVKLEDRHNDVKSVMDWFDRTDLRPIYERNKKKTILLMFSEELNQLCMSSATQPFQSRSHKDNCDEIFNAEYCPNLR